MDAGNCTTFCQYNRLYCCLLGIFVFFVSSTDFLESIVTNFMNSSIGGKLLSGFDCSIKRIDNLCNFVLPL